MGCELYRPGLSESSSGAGIETSEDGNYKSNEKQVPSKHSQSAIEEELKKNLNELIWGINQCLRKCLISLSVFLLRLY